jgi:Zn-dependent protease
LRHIAVGRRETVQPAMPSRPVGACLAFRLLGTPVWLHWSFTGVGLGIGVPVGLFGLFTFSDVALTLFAGSVAAVAAVVLVHEAGHVMVARLLSIKVHGVYLAAGGGCCVTGETAHELHELLYSAGGLLAQTVLLAGTALWLLNGGPDTQPMAGQAAAVFAAVNALLLTVNAWPAGGSDGERMLHALRALRQRS